MRLRQLITIGAALCAAASIPAGTAFAAPSPAEPRGTGFEQGCTVDICVFARYNGHGWDAFGAPQKHLTNGHLDIFGPDSITHHSGGDRPWEAKDASPTFSGTGSGNVCAEAWEHHPDGHYESVGLACIAM